MNLLACSDLAGLSQLGLPIHADQALRDHRLGKTTAHGHTSGLEQRVQRNEVAAQFKVNLFCFHTVVHFHQ